MREEGLGIAVMVEICFSQELTFMFEINFKLSNNLKRD